MKMREIADAAGVSLTAVSLVLNGKPGIGDEKRALVTRLLQENGYQILSTATPASSRRSWTPPERNAAATATIFL